MRVWRWRIHLDPSRRFSLAALGLVVAAFLLASLASAVWKRMRPRLTGDPLFSCPRVFLWAWERPEKLDFIHPRKVGVAVLAKTILLQGRKVTVRPRLQPLQAPPQTSAIAVVRIESQRAEPLPNQVPELAAEVSQLAETPGLAAIQIDFDAVTSERAFYRALLQEVRQRLPASVKLSITALVSWCLYDDWISVLPVDEAVPMLFRMGVERDAVLRYLRAGNDFRPRICRYSLGLSADEPLPALPSGRRLYLFHPRPWTARSLDAILKGVEQWQ
jgi:hypothetical protein